MLGGQVQRRAAGDQHRQPGAASSVATSGAPRALARSCPAPAAAARPAAPPSACPAAAARHSRARRAPGRWSGAPAPGRGSAPDRRTRPRRRSRQQLGGDLQPRRVLPVPPGPVSVSKPDVGPPQQRDRRGRLARAADQRVGGSGRLWRGRGAGCQGGAAAAGGGAMGRRSVARSPRAACTNAARSSAGTASCSASGGGQLLGRPALVQLRSSAA